MTATVEQLFKQYGPVYKWLATTTVMLGTVSAVLALTIVNVAIPNIMGGFGMDQTQAQWLATGFLAAMSATMLAYVWTVESFGTRRAYLGAMAVFSVALVLGALAPNENVLIAMRVVQGAAAGIIQPLSMLMILQVFPLNERGKGIGIYGMGVTVAAGLSPAVGGLLVDFFSWRAVLLAILPFCALGAFLALFFLPQRSGTGARSKFDWPGFIFLNVTLASTLWAFSNGQRLGWESTTIRGLLVLGVLSAVAFVFWELRCEKPLINLRIFRSLGFACAAIISCVVGAALFGTTYLFPLFTQHIQGYTATTSGFVLVPAAIAMAAAFPFAGMLVDRSSVDRPLIAGLLLLAASSFLMLRGDVHTAFWVLAFWIVLNRLGLALMMPSVGTGAMAALELKQLPQGSGIIDFSRQIGGTFGVNLLAITLARRTEFHATALSEELTPANPIGREALMRLEGIFDRAGVAADLQAPAAMDFLERMIILQGYTRGFHDAFFLFGLVLLAAIVPAWWMGREARRRAALHKDV